MTWHGQGGQGHSQPEQHYAEAVRSPLRTARQLPEIFVKGQDHAPLIKRAPQHLAVRFPGVIVGHPC